MLNDSGREYILASPRLIAVEGIDCAGKTTLLNSLVPHIQQRVAYHCERLNSVPFPVELFTPWEGATWSKTIREFFLAGVGDPDIELMLAFAARRALILNKVKPILDSGGFAIVDRYAASSFAYQVINSGNAYLWADLLRLTCEKIIPGLTIYLDVSPDVANNRMRIRNAVMDGFETRGLQYFQDVRERYQMAFLLLKSSAPNSVYTVIDASDPPEAVFSKARDIVNSYIDKMFSLEHDVIERASKFLETVAVAMPKSASIPQPR